MKESKQCGNCVGIFSFLSETSTVLCVAPSRRGAHAVSEHAVLFTSRHRASVTGSFISPQMEAMEAQKRPQRGKA